MADYELPVPHRENYIDLGLDGYHQYVSKLLCLCCLLTRSNLLWDHLNFECGAISSICQLAFLDARKY